MPEIQKKNPHLNLMFDRLCLETVSHIAFIYETILMDRLRIHLEAHICTILTVHNGYTTSSFVGSSFQQSGKSLNCYHY